jgi:hypothetical protein
MPIEWRRMATGGKCWRTPDGLYLLKSVNLSRPSVIVLTFRFASFALVALSSTVSTQFIDEVSDTDETTAILISNGVADCIDAMMYINDDSIDTTTIGTGATRTVAGVVMHSVPATDTETDVSNIIRPR